MLPLPAINYKNDDVLEGFFHFFKTDFLLYNTMIKIKFLWNYWCEWFF